MDQSILRSITIELLLAMNRKIASIDPEYDLANDPVLTREALRQVDIETLLGLRNFMQETLRLLAAGRR